ncbi:MAG: class I SAM-dependent methyltransferase [Candidatus Bathyarchaeota archaeon]|nr:class I SAM-dependent methyltransferase [Candidatus Bathyarchaeota archaeon]
MRIVSGWGRYQTAEEMEINRKYEYGPEFVPLLCQWLCPSPRPSSVVVDVGCGSGYFTKIMGRCMKGQGEVIGIDPDRRLVQEAEKICERKSISNIRFHIGNVWEIPLESNYADLVVSHIVLSNIPRQFDAILEMKRVAKIGGKVAVIDSARGGGQYFSDKRLNELYDRFIKAFGMAIDKEWRQKFDMSTYIENFHYRIPELFLKAGLTDISLNGHLSTFLLCDARRSIREMKTYLRARLDLWNKLENRNKECAVVGGMKEEEFHELFLRYTDYLEDLITHPEEIRKTPEVNIVSRVIVCGRKPHSL